MGLTASASVSNGTPEGGGASSTVKGGFGAARAAAATRATSSAAERVVEEDEIDSAQERAAGRGSVLRLDNFDRHFRGRRRVPQQVAIVLANADATTTRNENNSSVMRSSLNARVMRR